MRISNAVNELLIFLHVFENEKIDNGIHNHFLQHLRNKKYSENKINSIVCNLDIAEAKEFIKINPDAEYYYEFIDITEKYSDYIIEQEKNHDKFLHGLLGSAFTIIGGIIGAIIAVFA